VRTCYRTAAATAITIATTAAATATAVMQIEGAVYTIEYSLCPFFESFVE